MRLFMALPHQVLKVSEGGDSSTSLAGFNFFYHFFFSYPCWKFPCIQVLGIAYCPLAAHVWDKSDSLLSLEQLEIRVMLLSTPNLSFSRKSRFPQPSLHIMPHSSSTALGLTLCLLLGSPGVDTAELQTWPQWKGAAGGCCLLRQPGVF